MGRDLKMSGGLDALAITEDDITKMLAATTHIGSENSETTMEQYIFKKRNDGVNIINLKKTWEKLLLAARAIAAVENPQDVCCCKQTICSEGCSQVCKVCWLQLDCRKIHTRSIYKSDSG